MGARAVSRSQKRSSGLLQAITPSHALRHSTSIRIKSDQVEAHITKIRHVRCAVSNLRRSQQ